MEPLTHMLTGAVLARAGVNRRAAYATIAMVIAAEFPDIDTLWSLAGPLTGFEHHRGITHTFLGLPVEAALITAGFYLVHRLRKKPPTKAPTSWLWLYAGTLLALFSHLLLDWTNNYGLRPFFPFNPHWYAGSFVFIVEPVLYIILGAALLLPPLFGLINSEVGIKSKPFRGRFAAIAALVAIVAFYAFRFEEHALALDVMSHDSSANEIRFFASPHPINPFIWSGIAERPDSYLLSTITTRPGNITGGASDQVYKPTATLPILAAKRSELGRIYLDWSMYPVITEIPDNTDPNRPLVLVTFADARFMYDALGINGREHPPLTGSVLLDMRAPEGQRVVETRMDGKLQK